jgi:hypothetical protein
MNTCKAEPWLSNSIVTQLLGSQHRMRRACTWCGLGCQQRAPWSMGQRCHGLLIPSPVARVAATKWLAQSTAAGRQAEAADAPAQVQATAGLEGRSHQAQAHKPLGGPRGAQPSASVRQHGRGPGMRTASTFRVLEQKLAGFGCGLRPAPTHQNPSPQRLGFPGIGAPAPAAPCGASSTGCADALSGRVPRLCNERRSPPTCRWAPADLRAMQEQQQSASCSGPAAHDEQRPLHSAVQASRGPARPFQRSEPEPLAGSDGDRGARRPASGTLLAPLRSRAGRVVQRTGESARAKAAAHLP